MFSVHPSHVYLNILPLGGIVRRTRPRPRLGYIKYDLMILSCLMYTIHIVIRQPLPSFPPPQIICRLNIRSRIMCIGTYHLCIDAIICVTHIGYIIFMCTCVGVAITFNDSEIGFVYIQMLRVLMSYT